MRRIFVPSLLAVSVISLFGVASVRAEPGKIETVVDYLHQAETAADPLPLLEKAKGELKHFNPKPSQEGMIAHRIGPRRRAGVDEGAAKHKEEAMKALDEAIDTAKAGASKPVSGPAPLGSAMDTKGGDLKAKIESAIAKAHMAGELKH